MKIVLITPWVGEPPEWMSKFWRRIGASAPLIEWRFLPLDWRILQGLAKLVLKVDVPDEHDPRKLCDFRPAFGRLFAPELVGADWWGWCDLDCVFGDLPGYLPPWVLNDFDLITDHQSIVNGPFTIMKNNELMNDLFLEEPAIRHILESPEYFNFDEDGKPSGRPSICGGITGIVRTHDHVGPRFLGAHSHDGESDRPVLRDGKLWIPYEEGFDEIMTYHFSKAKEWPRSLNS